MKILVVYASTGSGHFKSAEAIYKYAKQEIRDSEVKLIDVLDYSNIFFRNAYVFSYALLVNHALWLWSIAFSLTYAKPLRRIIRWMRLITNNLHTGRFARLLIQENPDFIISTHFLPAEISAYLKNWNKISSKLITVITDFGIHPFWVAEGTDNYIVASEVTKEQLAFEGVKKDCIRASGIPVDLKFSKQYKKDDLCKKFGIAPDTFTALVVTGSFGIGPLEEIAGLLYKDAQVLVVCARNKKLFRRLKNRNYPGVKIFGLVDNIEELMAVSDIVITKPGGLTVSEILVMEIPPIFIAAIPGQERENVRVLAGYGVGKEIKNILETKEIVSGYKNNPHKLKSEKEKIRMIKKPSATQELISVIRQGSAGYPRGRAV